MLCGLAIVTSAATDFTVVQSQNNCWGDPPACLFRGRFDNWAACEAVCHDDSSCTSFTWVGATGPPYQHECRTRNDTFWSLTAESNHVSGFKGSLPPPIGTNCTIDEECSLQGICGGKAAGVCACDPGWRGADCGQLDLLPAVRGSGYNLTGKALPISSWGANIFPATADGTQVHAGGGAATTWHMYVSEFENHCDISHWSPNSAVVHSVSTSGPAGPYNRQSVAVLPFAHNPKVVRSPIDGTWLMYTIGVTLPDSDLFNCSSRSTTAQTRTGTAPSPAPGRNPRNRESNITLFTSPHLEGPWTRFGVVLGPDFEGTWDEDTSNPSPWVLANGTVLLMYRGCVVSQPGCEKEYVMSSVLVCSVVVCVMSLGVCHSIHLVLATFLNE